MGEKTISDNPFRIIPGSSNITRAEQDGSPSPDRFPELAHFSSAQKSLRPKPATADFVGEERFASAPVEPAINPVEEDQEIPVSFQFGGIGEFTLSYHGVLDVRLAIVLVRNCDKPGIRYVPAGDVSQPFVVRIGSGRPEKVLATGLNFTWKKYEFTILLKAGDTDDGEKSSS